MVQLGSSRLKPSIRAALNTMRHGTTLTRSHYGFASSSNTLSIARNYIERLGLSIDRDVILKRRRRNQYTTLAAPGRSCAEVGYLVSIALKETGHTAALTNGLRFVAVAGIGTKEANEWTDDAGNLWLTGVQAPGIGLYSYDHNVSKSDQDLWQSLFDHGQRLLQELLSLVENQHVMPPCTLRCSS